MTTSLVTEQNNPQLKEILKLGRREVVTYYVNKWAEEQNRLADALQAGLCRLKGRRDEAHEALREALLSRYSSQVQAWASSVRKLKGLDLTLSVHASWAYHGKKGPVATLSAKLQGRDLDYSQRRGLEIEWSVAFADLPKRLRSRLDSIQSMKAAIKEAEQKISLTRVNEVGKRDHRRALNEHMVARILEETQEGKDFLLALKGLQTTQVGRFLPELAGGAK